MAKATAAKGRSRARKAKETSAAAGFLEALKFVSAAQKKGGHIYQQHVVIQNQTISAFDGQLTIGRRIEEDLTACPQSDLLAAALGKCGEQFSITQGDNSRITIQSGKFKAVVPCVDLTSMPTTYPDPNIAVIDNRIKEGFAAVMALATEGAASVLEASLLLQANSVYATNKIVVLEFWHGIDLPPGLVIPKAAAQVIAKSERDLVGFGFSASSATFWFDDESFIKTQLFSECWPNVDAILNKNVNPWPLPDGFFDAVKAVASFTATGNVYFAKGEMRSHPDGLDGAQYEVEGLPAGQAYNGKLLLMIEPYMLSADFTSYNGQAFFFGDGIRGAIAGIRN
ncbi:DNA polymerase processivity factor [Escherichia phage Shy]|uniref:DNA polymerase III subunit n=1 Tax=Escherichia phage Halfdan TaxID=2234092 RepID=A0A2Z5H3D4_9CAUD|nr:DNA polymerase III subunit [Escherichia phage Halfdan]AXC34309.1 DNA polymerase III subunit [Escherichia phage Halfdan]WQZ00301.1 DNA polymerase processivity factor [Escherichia phage Shy]